MIIIIISNNNFITYNAQICTLGVHVYYQMRVKEKMNSRVNACMPDNSILKYESKIISILLLSFN